MEIQEQENLKQLMLQSLEGNQQSYKKLLTQLTSILKNYFSSRIYEKEYIEDLVQETLISIHRARHTYDPKLPLLNWVFSIAYRRYVDHIRKYSKIKKYEISTETFHQYSSKLQFKTNESYENKDRIRSVLEQMSERDRKIITLLKIENYSIKEAAKILNISESALKVAAHRAYKKIKKIIQDSEL